MRDRLGSECIVEGHSWLCCESRPVQKKQKKSPRESIERRVSIVGDTVTRLFWVKLRCLLLATHSECRALNGEKFSLVSENGEEKLDAEIESALRC